MIVNVIIGYCFKKIVVLCLVLQLSVKVKAGDKSNAI